jgi:hypothetical protein
MLHAALSIIPEFREHAGAIVVRRVLKGQHW